jgi:GT2 family glycosyltransferase
MLFTIIIATCDRPDRLLDALRSVRAAIEQAGVAHRVIVADNGTDRLAEQPVKNFLAEAGFDLKYIRSEPHSKAAALNAGIRAAETEWLAFTDDDCLPDPGWLKKGAGFAESSGFRVFTGKIISAPAEEPLPRWLPEGVTGELPWTPAFFDYPLQRQSGALDPKEAVPYGANIFVAADVFKEYGDYDEALWRKCGRAALGAEDAEFAIRIRDRGVRIGFCRDALVVHPVYPERTTLRYYLRHIFRSGVREPLFVDRGQRASLAYLARTMTSCLLKSAGRVLRGDATGAVRELMEAARDAGEIWGWLRLRNRQKTAFLQEGRRDR